jgi:hypothetical protein
MSHLAKKRQGFLLICLLGLFVPGRSRAQASSDYKLDKMPADLETQFALSALPPHLRAAATVYLLDPDKGYYVGRQGSSGFICFVDRTDWEWSEFRKDVCSAVALDPEGARTIFPVDREVAAMRASGKFTPRQIKDSMVSRYRRGIYKAPGKGGISYMLAPVMRVYTGKPGDESVMTIKMPHYMFYAPYASNADIGLVENSPHGPWLVNVDEPLFGKGKGPVGFIIMPASDAETAKIAADGKDLLKRLAAYSPYFRVDDMATMHH